MRIEVRTGKIEFPEGDQTYKVVRVSGKQPKCKKDGTTPSVNGVYDTKTSLLDKADNLIEFSGLCDREYSESGGCPADCPIRSASTRLRSTANQQFTR